MDIFVASNNERLGPFTREQLVTAIQQKRVALSDLAWRPGNAEWTPLNKMTDVVDAIRSPLPNATVPGASQVPEPSRNPTKPRRSLGVASLTLSLFPVIAFVLFIAFILHIEPSHAPESVFLVFTILALLALWCMPAAIICGHIARRYARTWPTRYGGLRIAMSGLALGYLGIFASLALFVPSGIAISTTATKTNSKSCILNMKMIDCAFRLWQFTNGGKYPFQVSTNNGGTLELCSVGSNGFDRNAAFHFQVISNELPDPRYLLCPSDSGRMVASFRGLRPANVSYQLRTGTNIDEAEVLAVCPIHNHVLMNDGSVHIGNKGRQ